MMDNQINNGSIKPIYNPHLLDKKTLIENFVVRKNVFKSIFEHDIVNSDMERPDNHILITGQRGMGKTTLLLRLKYAVGDHEELREWLVPIIFKENEYYVDSLFNLWIVVLEYLISATENIKDKEDFEELLEDINFNHDHPRYKEDKIAFEKFVFEKIVQVLQKKGKKLILFIDNFHEILEALDRTETQILRERLITCAEMKIIAASSKQNEALKEYSGTLYENFKKIELGQLKDEEIVELYKQLSRTAINSKVQSKKDQIIIDSFKRLTNGVTRNMIILFDTINSEEIGNTSTKLKQILDELTPYLEQKINRLKPQSRKIFHAIAFNYDGISVKEVSKATRLSSKAVSSSLVPLVKNELIKKIETSTKNHLYIVKERLLNIWYLMRYGKGQGAKNIEYSIRFLEEWLTWKGVEYNLEKLLDSYKVSDYDPTKQKLIESFLKHDLPKEIQEELTITHNRKERVKKRELKYHEDILEYTHTLKNRNFPFSQEGAKKFVRLLYLSNIDISAKEKILTKFSKLSFAAYENILNTLQEERNFIKNEFQTNIIGKTRDTFERERYADKHRNILEYSLINPDFDYNQEEFRDLLYLSSMSLSTKRKIINKFSSISKETYQKILKELKAESAHLKKIAKKQILKDIDNENIALATLYKNYLFLPNQSLHHYEKSMQEGKFTNYELAKLYLENKHIRKAEKHFRLAINEHTLAAHELGLIYRDHFKTLEKAKKYFKLSYNNTSNGQSLFNYAGCSYKLKDFEEARDAYTTLLKRSNWQEGDIYNDLGNVYYKLDNFNKAEENYKLAIQLGEKEQHADKNMANLYIKNNKFKEGEAVYVKLIKDDDMEAANSLAWNYYLKNHAPKQALKYAKQAFSKRPNSFHFAHTYATVLVWNNKLKDVLEPCKVFLQQLDKHKEFSKDVMDFLILLIAKKGYELAYDLFMDKEYRLRDRYAAIYYALMREEKMKKKHPNEYLKMGSELTETVKEIQDKIKEKRVDYA